MKIPVSARVVCQEGECGRVTLFVIDSRRSRLNQLVIETYYSGESVLPQDAKIPVERLVPADWLSGIEGEAVFLACSRAQLLACPPLHRSIMISDPGLLFRMTPDVYHPWPYYYIASQAVEKVNLPAGEVWIDRKAGVITRDERYVGKVAGIAFDPTTRRLTGLAIYEGFFWNRREVELPITNVNRFEEDTVYINQVYQKVAHLPGVPIH